MSTFETADTEEMATCLYLTVYHPSQEEKQVFRALNFHQRQTLRADELVKFGRDCSVCHFNFIDARVSRIQFALQFYRHFDSSEFGFEIKNLSKKVKLIVDNIELSYMNKISLPETCIVHFGDYQILMQKQEGQCEDHFEIIFELAKTSLLQENDVSFLHKPIPECNILHRASPTEMDENE